MRRFAIVTALLVSATAAADPVELLHNVPSQIAVSSEVESKTIKPEQLVDRDRATAWNSKTGDLVGAWIEFRVPSVVTVDDIKLIVGHTGKGPEGDYFPMNHRIKRVRVLREGEKVGDFTLDPNSRELQAIHVGKPGGVYRIQVLEVVTGTKKNWRELCVAELEVWGTLPPGMEAREHMPATYWSFAVGKLPGEPMRAYVDARPQPTWADRCRENLCKGTDPAAPGALTLHPKGSKIKTVFVEAMPGYSYARLYIETAAGWYYCGGLGLASYSVGSSTVKLEELSVKDEIVRVQIDMQGDDHASHARWFDACGLTAAGAPACLGDPIGVDVVDKRLGNEYHHVARVENGFVKIARSPAGNSWDWIVGDHPVPWR